MDTWLAWGVDHASFVLEKQAAFSSPSDLGLVRITHILPCQELLTARGEVASELSALVKLTTSQFTFWQKAVLLGSALDLVLGYLVA